MKKNNMKSIGILTGLWLLLFLNCGQRMAAQIRNKVCDTIPYEFIQEKIIIPVTVNGIKVKNISSIREEEPERCMMPQRK